MAPEQEPEPASAPPEDSGTPHPRRRGRRGGRGRRGPGRRPPPQLAHEPPPPVDEAPEPAPEVTEPAPVERDIPASPPRESRTASPAAVQQAIEEVNHIIETLRGALEEMEEVLETLELAERQQNADEQEIETLRRGLRQLHRPREAGEHPHRH